MDTTTESEKVIRSLYEITNAYDKGFETQVTELLILGLERFNLDIGILSRIHDGIYTVQQCVVPKDVELSSGVTFDFDTTYCHITCKAKVPVAIENMGKDDKYASHPAYASFGLESYIGIPVKLDGKVYGTLNFSSARPYPRKFKQVDIDAIKLMASWIEGELIRRKQENELKDLNSLLSKMAFEDSLTTLPNRRALFDHLNSEINRAFRQQSFGSLALIDIDFFKQINDTFGHQKGDQVLSAIAEVLIEQKRNYDFVARFGGEEFVLWLPEISVKSAVPICQRINKAVSSLSVVDTEVTLSFGIVEYQFNGEKEIDIEKTIDKLIDKADIALYKAKDLGRNRVEVYS